MSLSIDPISIPKGKERQIRDLYRMMRDGNAAIVGPDGQQHPIPENVYQAFLQVLRDLEAGKAVSIVPYAQPLTTQQAANILGVSRQFLVKLLDDRKLPFHRVGTHRRINLKALLDYQRRRNERRRRALDRMTQADLDAGIYDKVVIPDE